MLPVREDYKTYIPPAWIKHTVCELLESLSVEHVGGLFSIVLTESAQIRKGKTRRVAGRKYALKECLGFYRGRWRGEPPAIFLVVDNIIRTRPTWFWRLPLAGDVALGAVLFHEIGHHLNATVGSLAGGEEASAEEWKRRLSRIHLRRKYWYLRPLRTPLRLVLIALRAFMRSRSGPSQRKRQP
jgi:hypothetical protein